MAEFSVEVVPQSANNMVVLRPIGSIDAATTPTLQKHLESAIDNGQCLVILDLGATDFLSSAGVGLIVGSVSTFREKGGDLVLMQTPPEIRNILELMSIEDYFQLIDNLDDLKYFAG